MVQTFKYNFYLFSKPEIFISLISCNYASNLVGWLLLELKLFQQGFAIGNGLTDPAIQYKAYTDYALDMGIIKKSDHDRINKVVPVCEMAIKLCGNVGSNPISASFNFLWFMLFIFRRPS